MIREHDRVVLERDVREQGLLRDDVGTVVHVYQGGAAFEVEFLTVGGETLTVAALKSNEIRKVGRQDVAVQR